MPKNNKSINKKSSFNKNNEPIKYKFKKKNGIRSSVNFVLNNNKKINDRTPLKSNNNITYRSEMHLLMNNQSKIMKTKANNEPDNKYAKNNPVNISSYKKIPRKTDRSYKKNLFL
jgi:hypothetical protein